MEARAFLVWGPGGNPFLKENGPVDPKDCCPRNLTDPPKFLGPLENPFGWAHKALVSKDR